MNEFTPLFYTNFFAGYNVPVVFKKTSESYEGYHEPFQIRPGAIANDMEVRTRNYWNK